MNDYKSFLHMESNGDQFCAEVLIYQSLVAAFYTKLLQPLPKHSPLNVLTKKRISLTVGLGKH